MFPVRYTTSQIANILGIPESQARRWIDTGRIMSYRVPGGDRRIPETVLRRFMKDNGYGKLAP